MEMKFVFVLFAVFFPNGCLSAHDKKLEELQHLLRILRRKFDIQDERLMNLEVSLSMCFSSLSVALQNIENLILESKHVSQTIPNRPTDKMKSPVKWPMDQTFVAKEVARSMEADAASSVTGSSACAAGKSSDNSTPSDLSLLISRMDYLSDQLTAAKTCSICILGQRPETDCSRFCKPRSCSEVALYNVSNAKSMVEIYPQKDPIEVVCTKDGWMVILRYKKSERKLFDRTWKEYKDGFGNLNGIFWIGNENLHLITKEEPMNLVIESPKSPRINKYYQVEAFQIDSEENSYMLHIGEETYNKVGAVFVNSTKFVTKDRDDSCKGCAVSSGWWFSSNSTKSMNEPSIFSSDDLVVVKIRSKKFQFAT